MLNQLLKLNKDYPAFLLLLNIVITLLTGFVAAYFLKLPGTDSFVISVVIALTLSVLQLTLSNRNIEKNMEEIGNKFPVILTKEKLSYDERLSDSILNISHKSIEIIDSFSSSGREHCIENIYLNEVYKTVNDCENKLDQIKNGVIRVITAETRDFWSKMIQNVNSSFFTTNYSMFNGSFGRINSEALLEIQKQTINRIGKGKFERLFVFDTEDEFVKLKDLIEAQKNIGINVRAINRSEYKRVAGNQGWIQRVGSADFSIIDNKYLYVTHLENGNVSHIEMIKDDVRLKDALTFAGIIKDYTKRV